MTTVAQILVSVVGLYLGVGLLFAIFFVWKGAARIDPVARKGSWGFRLIILPGATALWPLLARRWWGGASEPPEECNAHRREAQRSDAETTP